MSHLEIESRIEDPEIVVMTLRGTLDAGTWPILDGELRRWRRDGVARFLLDVENLVRATISGAAILQLHVEGCRENGGEVATLGPCDPLDHRLDQLGVPRLQSRMA